MTRFSSEFVHLCPELVLEAIEKTLDCAEAARLPANRVIDVSPVAKIPHKTRDLFQIGLRRNIELSMGFIHSFNAGLFIPLFVLSRASIETACLVWDCWRQLDQIVAGRDKASLDTFDQFLDNAILGAKSKTWSVLAERYPAPNVLTIIDHLVKAGYSGLRECYDLLCEYAHPNYHGMHGVYCVIDDVAYETRYVDRPMQTERERLQFALRGVDIALSMSLFAVEQHERALPEFTLLCEEAIHDTGTWPKDLEYPLVRGPR